MPATPATWLNDFIVNLTIDGIKTNPRVTHLANGNILVVWDSTDDSGVGSPAGIDIIGQVFNPLGELIGGEVRLTSGFGNYDAWNTGIAAMPSGRSGATVRNFEAVDTSIRIWLAEHFGGALSPVGMVSAGSGIASGLFIPRVTVGSATAAVFADLENEVNGDSGIVGQIDYLATNAVDNVGGPTPARGAVSDNPYAIALAYVPDDTLFPNQWHLNNTGQSGGVPGVDLNLLAIWDEFTGAGVTIGIWDDGIEYDHPDLNDNYDAGLHITVNGTVHDPYPEGPGSVHGTAVAGVIAAENNGTGTVGVAFGATIAGVDIKFDSVHDFTATAGMTSELDTFDVTNHSWGFTTPFAANTLDNSTFWTNFFDGIEDSTTTGRGGLGTINVVAAGNDRASGRDSNDSNFTNLPQTISVAAVGHDGFVASFSTPGAANLASGPWNGPTGSGIWTTDRVGANGFSDGTNESGNTSSDYTNTFGGTSSAAPAVTGVVALMLEANPLLGWRDVQDILAMSARHTGSALTGGITGSELYNWEINGATNWNSGGMHFSNDYGFGLVDAFAAVRLAESWTQQDTAANWQTVVSSTWTGTTVIPDNTPAGVSFNLVVAGDTTELEHVGLKVSFNLASFTGDYLITLTSPSGTISYLSRAQNNGDSFNGDFFLSSNAFRGEDGNGTWVVNVSDRWVGNIGTLEGLQLEFYGNAASTDDIYVFTDEYSTLLDAVLGYGFGVTDTNGGEDTFNLAALTSDSTVVLDDGGIIDGVTLGSFAVQPAEITGIEHVIGGDGNDSFTGNADGNRLSGMRGGDTLSGLGGDDTLSGGAGADTLSGGTENDTFLLASQAEFDGDTIDGGAGTGDLIRFTAATAGALLQLTSQVTGVEIVELAAGATALNLDVADVNNGLTIRGNDGANTITGTELGDTITGAGGADTLNGGSENDVFLIASQAEFNGDTIDGGTGTGDLIRFTAATAGALLQLTSQVTGVEIVELAAGTTALNLDVADVNNGLTVRGNNGANSITGTEFADTIIGGAGIDTMGGGGGSDILFVDNPNDIIIEAIGGGFDTVRSTVTYTLAAGVEVERLSTTATGGTGPINLTGNAFAQEIYGNAGANTLNGGIDNLRDILTGYGGNDIYVINSALDIIVEGVGGGTSDRVQTSVTFTMAADDNIEIFQTTNAALTTAINLTGNSIAQAIYGNAGANTLSGGIDVLSDTLIGYGGNDIYVIHSANDLIVEGVGQGASDRVQATVSFALAADDNIEIMQTTNAGFTTSINLTGNVGGQAIYGNAAVNVLNGGLDSARDTLIGYGGNDTYVINSTADLIVEGVGAGAADRAQTSVTFTLAADDNIEIFETTNAVGVTALNLTGNAVIQSVTGNAGANTLNGGLGNDTLTGLGGADNFLFNTALNAATNHDTITDFNVAADTIQLENAIFTLLAATGTLAANLFEGVSIAGQSGSEVVIYDRVNGDLYYDTNGTGTAGGLVRFAEVTDGTLLTNADFFVV